MKKKLLKMFKLFSIVVFFTYSYTSLQAQSAAALYFDGLDDYAAAPVFTITSNNNFSFETAVKITTVSPVTQFIVYNGNSASDGYGFFVPANSTSLSVLFGGIAFNNTTYTLTPGVWTYLTATFDSGTLNLYVNGVLNQTLSTTNPNPPTTGSFVIGSDPTGNSNFNGSIDETRLWSRVLCPAEILNNYNGELSSIQPGLLAYYRYNQGIASGNNTTITSAMDDVSSSNLTLNNFALTGTVSNWVAPGAVVSGSYVPSYVSITGSTVICQGNSANLTASTSATSYTWNTGSNNLTISPSPTTTTIYSVVATNTAGCMGSATFTLNVNTCAGIKNINNALENTINIYPNPSNGVFNIQLNENSSIEVSDVLGNIILTDKITASTYNLNLSTQAQGIYILKVRINEQVKTARLVKE